MGIVSAAKWDWSDEGDKDQLVSIPDGDRFRREAIRQIFPNGFSIVSVPDGDSFRREAR